MPTNHDEIREKTGLVCQAERVIRKFGNARRLWRVLMDLGIRYEVSTIYKWAYPRSKQGRGGMIPSRAWGDILKAARSEGVVITSEDFDPRPMKVDVVRLRYVGKENQRHQKKPTELSKDKGVRKKRFDTR